MTAFLFTMWGTVIYYISHGEALGILPYEYPNIVIYSTAVLVFFKEIVSKIRMSEKYVSMVYSISKLTFGIYLIHVLLLKIWYSFGVNIQIFHPVLSIPFVALVVFVSGGIIIWFVRKIPVIGTYLA